MDKRCNWRVIEADGNAERVNRDGAAYYLRLGRKQGRKWKPLPYGWTADA